MSQSQPIQTLHGRQSVSQSQPIQTLHGQVSESCSHSLQTYIATAVVVSAGTACTVCALNCTPALQFTVSTATCMQCMMSSITHALELYHKLTQNNAQYAPSTFSFQSRHCCQHIVYQVYSTVQESHLLTAYIYQFYSTVQESHLLSTYAYQAYTVQYRSPQICCQHTPAKSTYVYRSPSDIIQVGNTATVK